MRTIPLWIAVSLAGCATVQPSEPFKGPNGRQAYTMQCSGMGRTMEQCYQSAAQLCPAGYDIIDRPTGPTALVPVGGMLMAAQRQGLTVECK